MPSDISTICMKHTMRNGVAYQESENDNYCSIQGRESNASKWNTSRLKSGN